jgi:hypothetical protein
VDRREAIQAAIAEQVARPRPLGGARPAQVRRRGREQGRHRERDHKGARERRAPAERTGELRDDGDRNPRAPESDAAVQPLERR